MTAAGWQATGFDSDRRLIGLAGHLGDKVEALDAQHWNLVDDRFWEHPLHLHHFAPFGLERWLEAHGCEHEVLEAGRPTELMRGGSLPLDETWEAVRRIDPSLSRLFYQLGVGRSREMIWRKTGTQGA